MAVLNKPPAQSGFEVENLAPAGTFVATCIDVKDDFNITRKKFQSEEMETVDLATFLFGFRDRNNNAHKVASASMKQSGHEKAALFKFLRSWLGAAPKYGWDYCEMKGKKALITVEHKTSRDGARTFANISVICPVPEGMTMAPAAAPAPVAPPPVQQAPAEFEDELAYEGDNSDIIPF